MAPPVVSPERGAVAPDVLPFWGADHTVPRKKHLTEACKKHLDISNLHKPADLLLAELAFPLLEFKRELPITVEG